MDYQLHFQAVWPYAGQLAYGTWLTIKLTAISVAGGLAVGTIGAACRTGSHRWLSAAVGVYVEAIRNTPLLVQLFFIFFGLPSAGIKITATEAAVLAMIINLGAYATEIIRAGIEAVHRSQIEAAQSLGLSRLQTFRHVIVVPALMKIWPALSSQCVFIMLGSSLVSQISAQELTFTANFIASRNFRSFEVYVVATLIYLVLSVGLRQILRLVGRHALAKR